MPSASENLPRISIIMPTLNAEAILDNCLASIARQTYPRDKMEIILADAHSKDATRDIAKRYGAGGYSTTTARTWRKASAWRSATPPANISSLWMPTTKSRIPIISNWPSKL